MGWRWRRRVWQRKGSVAEHDPPATPAKFEVEGGAPNFGDPWETALMVPAFRRWLPVSYWYNGGQPAPPRPSSHRVIPDFQVAFCGKQSEPAGAFAVSHCLLDKLGNRKHLFPLSLSLQMPAQPFTQDHYSPLCCGRTGVGEVQKLPFNIL